MITRRNPDALIRLVYVLGLVLAFASPGNGLYDSFLPVARLRISAWRLSCGFAQPFCVSRWYFTNYHNHPVCYHASLVYVWLFCVSLVYLYIF